jgi:hypothetical protein
VGHNIKTANRAEAINRNAARVKVLAEKIEEMGGLVGKIREELMEQVDLLIEQMQELENDFAEEIRGVKDRLDLVERSIWRKIMDKMSEVVDRGDPAKPANRAIQLDIHSTRHEAHSVIKKKDQEGKEVKEDGAAESGND